MAIICLCVCTTFPQDFLGKMSTGLKCKLLLTSGSGNIPFSARERYELLGGITSALGFVICLSPADRLLSEEEGSGRKMVALSAEGCMEPRLSGGAGLQPSPGHTRGEIQNTVDSRTQCWHRSNS